MNRAFLGLGSNIGDRLIFLTSAINELKNSPDIQITSKSSVYETEPWGFQDQNCFLNLVIEIHTSLNPEELLAELKKTEVFIGRKPGAKWRQREIDIDILFYGNTIMKNDFLQIPHPEFHKRNFVLMPLNEIAPEFRHPVFNKTVNELLLDSKDILKCWKYSGINM